MDQKEKDKKTWGGHLLAKETEIQPTAAAENNATTVVQEASSSTQSMFWIALVAAVSVAVAAWAFAA